MSTIRSRNLSVPQREPAIERRISSTGPGFLTGRCRTGAGRGTGEGGRGSPGTEGGLIQAPAYMQAQVANYQAALDRLGGG